MRTVIVGDSFVQYIKDTWLEQIVADFGLDVVAHRGFPGGCEYFIYEFLEDAITRGNIELVIMTHTEAHRLVNPLYKGITPIVSTTDFKSDLPDDMREAAKQYYTHLYHKRYHDLVHDMLIAKTQELCNAHAVRQVHLQSFNNPVPMKSGLWIVNGLHELATLAGEDYYRNHKLLNHFTPAVHEKFAAWLSIHMKYVFKNNLPHHVAMLYREEFA